MLGGGGLTASRGREEGGDSAAGRPDPLRQRALWAELDGDLACEVLPLQRLVAAEEGHDHPVHLAVLGQEGESASAFGAGVVGHGCEGVEGIGTSSAQCCNQGGCVLSVWCSGHAILDWAHLHATPHSPNPELKTTEPLWMSATASSAVAYSFDSPRFTGGATTDRQCLVDCEKLQTPSPVRARMPRNLVCGQLIANRVVDATRAGAARRTTRGTLAMAFGSVQLLFRWLGKEMGNLREHAALESRVAAIRTNSNALMPLNCPNIWRGPEGVVSPTVAFIRGFFCPRRAVGKYVTGILGLTRGRQTPALIQHRASAVFFTGPALPAESFVAAGLRRAAGAIPDRIPRRDPYVGSVYHD